MASIARDVYITSRAKNMIFLLSATNRICAKRHFLIANDDNRFTSRDPLMTLCPIAVVFAGLRGRKEFVNLLTRVVC